jgi:hypothetical protein
MKLIIFISLIVSIQTSLIIHIYSLIGYISTKKLHHFRNFMVTAACNIFMGIGLAIIVAVDQKIVGGLNLNLIFILESGLLFVYMVAIKVRLTITIIRRLKNADNYHLSHFGKKIYHTTIVDFKEVMTYFVTLPFTMMAGAYFIVKILSYK